MLHVRCGVSATRFHAPRSKIPTCVLATHISKEFATYERSALQLLTLTADERHAGDVGFLLVGASWLLALSWPYFHSPPRCSTQRTRLPLLPVHAVLLVLRP